MSSRDKWLSFGEAPAPVDVEWLSLGVIARNAHGATDAVSWTQEEYLMPWFRKSQLEPLAVTMSGVKLGDRLLIVGATDSDLIAALAGKAGLTGRACVVDANEATSRGAATLAEREGALVEAFTSPWTMLPFEPHAFDVVVIRDVLKRLESDARLRAVVEVYRILRPGGRTVVIEDAKRGAVSALFRSKSSNPQYERSGGATHVLEVAGFRGARTLAEREGQIFVEGIKPAT